MSIFIKISCSSSPLNSKFLILLIRVSLLVPNSAALLLQTRWKTSQSSMCSWVIICLPSGSLGHAVSISSSELFSLTYTSDPYEHKALPSRHLTFDSSPSANIHFRVTSYFFNLKTSPRISPCKGYF